MTWWHLVQTDKGKRVVPRWVTKSRFPDLLPKILWRRGVVCFGDRLHFCVGHLDTAHRPIEWKGTDWLVGWKPFTAAHRERDPNKFDNPDSNEAEP